MKKSYILLLLVILIIGCGNPKGIKSQFLTNLKLYPDSTYIIENEYFKSAQIYNLTDSLLAITVRSMNFTTGDHLIYIVSKKSSEIVKKLAPGGRGPQELLRVHSVSILNSNLYFYDPTTFKILIYNYNNDSIRFQTLVKNKSYYRNLHVIDNNEFLSYGFFDGHMYSYLDLNKGEESFYLEFPYLPDIPEEKQLNMGMARFSAYPGSIIQHPDHLRFAFYSTTSEYIQIVELDESGLHEIITLNFAPIDGQVVFKKDTYVWEFNEKSKYCFTAGTASDKLIYLLYSGGFLKDTDSVMGKYIFIFDWNGSIIKMIELDQKVYGICVDKDDRELFALTTNNKTFKNEILHYTL